MLTKINRSFFIITIMVLPLLNLAQSNTREQLTVTLSKPGKSFKLSVKLDKGNIKVVAYDGNNIEIEAEPLVSKAEKTAPKQNQNSNINTNTNTNINVNEKPAIAQSKSRGGKYITVAETNNSVSITPVTTSKNLTVVVKVPKTDGRFKLDIVYQGDIAVLDVVGEVEANSINGTILLSNISGSAITNLVTGDITATFKTINEKSPMAFSTFAGKLDITFPAGIKTNLKLKTDSGGLFTDFDIAEDNSKAGGKPKPGPNANANANKQPKFKLNNSGWVYGKINRGGPEIMIKNSYGNIYLRKGL